MFLVIVEAGEAYSVAEESFLEFLDMKAAGGDRGLDRYGVSIGDSAGDVTGITANQALALAEKIRAEHRMGLSHIRAA